MLTRREFIEASAVTGASLAVLGPLEFALAKTSADDATQSDTSYPNICTMCASGCGIKVQVDERGGLRRAVKIDGNGADPFNQGRLCPRGQSGLRLAYSPERITRPLIRVAGSKRGEWRFRAASWEEAYAYIERRERELDIQPYEKAIAAGWVICAYYRPEVVAFAVSSEIPNIYGTPMQPCVTGEHFGIDTVTGNFNIHDEVQADYGNARYFLAIGSNASVAAISTGRALDLARNLEKTKVVVLDPRLSELAAHADTWIPIKPGTDLAFTLAMLHEMLGHGYYDAQFVAAHTNAPFLLDEQGQPVMKTDPASHMPSAFYVYDATRGQVVETGGVFHNDNTVAVDGSTVAPALAVPQGLLFQGKRVQTVLQALQQKVATFTPEWAAAITDVSAATIREVAHDFGTTRPALVEPGWHDGRYRNSIMLRRSVAMLQALVGGIDRRGGWIFAGEYHEMMADMLAYLRKGGDLQKYPGMLVPGIMSPQGVLATYFDNPQAWNHKHPGISYAWSEQQFSEGKQGVAFPLFPNLGYLEGSKGQVQWQGKPYRLRSFYMYQANPIRNAMSSTAWQEFLADPGMGLVVAIDIMPNDSNAYADVILPDQVYLERQDLLFDLGHSHQRGIRLREPSVTPPKGTKPALDILSDLAAMRGVPFWQTVAEFNGWDPAAVAETAESARRSGGSAVAAVAEYQIREAARAEGVSVAQLKRRLRRDGLVVFDQAEPLLARWAMPDHLPVPTPSGRLELFSLITAGFIQEHGYRPEWDPLIAWIPPETPAAGGHLAADEFFFAYGKAPVQSHTATANNDLLMALSHNYGDQYLGIWVNPASARRLRIGSGDRLELRNTATGDTVQGTAFLTEMVRPDTVYMMSNFGVHNRLLVGAGQGTALSQLVTARPESVVGAPRSGEFTVRLRKL